MREWPTAPEAWQAQPQLADIQFEKLKDFEDAFKSYRYLLDFYSSQCDYGRMADMLYQVAGVMKIEGKELVVIDRDYSFGFGGVLAGEIQARYPEAKIARVIAGLGGQEVTYEDMAELVRTRKIGTEFWFGIPSEEQ